jgi:D-alanyl-lipoteichoic acid acyltransferase DltB (MBOAT superfamily)
MLRGAAAAAQPEGTAEGTAEAPRRLDTLLAGYGKLGLVALQLGLAVVVIRQFQIESRAFLHLSVLTFFGFLVHELLPRPWKPPFFLALSLGGIVLVCGAATGAWLVGLGLALFGICHLPIPLRARVATLVAAGGLLAFLRAGGAPVPWSAAVWPLLASMFMFRLAVYLYDTRHEKEPAPWSQRLGYFFLLPNVCFPLFPVVDYKTFRRTYYDADRYEIYQVGMLWIARGLVHLLLYRFVYYRCTIPAGDVSSATDLARFMVSTFLLYLRVSGQFHLIVGMLHLFGFNLPETHHLYYLAPNINDFWRRINIYWKDFMMKLFYYPAFFALRRRGETRALVLSTLVVFAGTWILHSYQWFWLRGSFPITLQDGLFWGILGSLVVVNSLWETRRGRARSLARRSRSPGETATLALRTAGTFVFLCVLWSLWNSESVPEWLSMWKAAARGGAPLDAGLVPTLLVAGVVAGEAARGPRKPAGGARLARRPGFAAHAARSSAWVAALCLLGFPAVYTRLGSDVAEVVDALREARLSDRDAAMLQKGYYEDLIRVDRFNSQLWEIYTRRPADWGAARDTAVRRHTHDFRYAELLPSASMELQGARFSTNPFGMRDGGEREIAKPPGTCRIALLGSSHVQGAGVGDAETFAERLEALLQADAPRSRHARYEVLNFGVGAYTPLEILWALEHKALDFGPDALVYVAHSIDVEQVVARLAAKAREGIGLPYPRLVEAIERAGVGRGTAQSVAERRLAPLGPELVEWIYGRIVQEARARGIPAVWIYLPRISERVREEDEARLFDLAKRAGFEVIDLRDLYAGRDIDSLRLAEWDYHPNAEGHALIAERIHRELLERRAEIPLGLLEDEGAAAAASVRPHGETE